MIHAASVQKSTVQRNGSGALVISVTISSYSFTFVTVIPKFTRSTCPYIVNISCIEMIFARQVISVQRDCSGYLRRIDLAFDTLIFPAPLAIPKIIPIRCVKVVTLSTMIIAVKWYSRNRWFKCRFICRSTRRFVCGRTSRFIGGTRGRTV